MYVLKKKTFRLLQQLPLDCMNLISLHVLCALVMGSSQNYQIHKIIKFNQ